MVGLDTNPLVATDVVREIQIGADPDQLTALEWLVTNGLGGYASGTLGGVLTRRYHALLIAALPAPLGRVVLVSRLDERVRLPGGRVCLADESVGSVDRVPGPATSSRASVWLVASRSGRMTSMAPRSRSGCSCRACRTL
jgi:hypothetical protein